MNLRNKEEEIEPEGVCCGEEDDGDFGFLFFSIDEEGS